MPIYIIRKHASALITTTGAPINRAMRSRTPSGSLLILSVSLRLSPSNRPCAKIFAPKSEIPGALPWQPAGRGAPFDLRPLV